MADLAVERGRVVVGRPDVQHVVAGGCYVFVPEGDLAHLRGVLAVLEHHALSLKVVDGRVVAGRPQELAVLREAERVNRPSHLELARLLPLERKYGYKPAS